MLDERKRVQAEEDRVRLEELKQRHAQQAIIDAERFGMFFLRIAILTLGDLHSFTSVIYK